jgi:hypothetical protein
MSAWYHVVAQYDSTQATSDRAKLYVNGVRLTAFDGASTYPGPSADSRFNQASVEMAIGRLGTYDGNYFNGYIAEVQFIDGQALTPSSFGETDATTGRWKAKAYVGTYGTNGFYLPFLNTSTGSNSVLSSENFSAAMYYTDAASITTNTTTAPNGTLTADTLTENTVNTFHRVGFGNLTYTNGVTFTSSVYVKANTRSAVAIENWNGATANYCHADLSTGTIISGSHASAAITSVGSGWYRISVSNVGVAGGAGCGTAIYTKNDSSTLGIVYTGNGSGSVFLWGMQTEASSTVGPYLATNGTAIGSTLLLGADASVSTGGYNSFVANNLSVTPGSGNDSLVDSPTNFGSISTTLVDDTYQISKSLRFNSLDSAYLSRTPSVAGNRKTWTWSGWVKRGTLGGNNVFMGNTDASGYNGLYFQFDTNNNITIGDYGVGSYAWVLTTSQVFRDTSLWYHIVATFDSTQATASDRVSVYINGTKITAFATATYPSPKDLDGRINSTQLTAIGRLGSYNGFYFDGYLAEVNFIDGQALTPSSFGTRDINTYLWKPKAYTGTYGTNGFYLNFSDSSNTTATTLGKDQAGSNNWTPSGTPGFSVGSGVGNDSLVDSPTYYGTDNGAGGEARGDYATLNPLFGNTGGTITDGNLVLTHTGGANGKNALGVSSVAVSSGKWYGEVTSITANQASRFGIFSTANTTLLTSANPYLGTAVDGYSAFAGGGTFKENNNINTAITNFGASVPAAGDVYMVALDMDNNKVWFGRNGSWANGGNPATGTVETFSILSGRSYYFACNNYTDTQVANFGQRPFAYAAPSGFKALRDYNKLPVPTGGEVRGNYATLNPLDFSCPGTISNGNLQYVQSTLNPRGGRSTIAVSSGKWYWEVTNNGGNNCPGIIRDIGALTSSYIGSNADGWGYFIDGQKYNSGTGTNYGASYTTNDVIGIALNMDAGTLVFYKNGVSQGTAFSGLSGTMSPAFSSSNGSAVSFTVNFGQRPWAYDAPFGFLPLCTTLLPQPIVQKSNQYVDTSIYTGTGATQLVTNGGFQPDFLWIKTRSTSASNTSHQTFNSVAGHGKVLYTDLTNAEFDSGANWYTPTSNGISLTSSTQLNFTGTTYVAWSWKESVIAGFDIVGYVGNNSSGQTIPHSLGVAPKLVIVKNRTTASDWPVYHSSLPANNIVFLGLPQAQAAISALAWGGVSAVSNTTFTVTIGSVDIRNVNKLNDNYVAYCFSEVEGFSKIGSYSGNNSVDGGFVWCGFRPRWVMVKRADGSENWTIIDTVRNPFNAASNGLFPSGNFNEQANMTIDVLSNGFKLRSNATVNGNASGTGNYIFAAFAEQPFKYARAR